MENGRDEDDAAREGNQQGGGVGRERRKCPYVHQTVTRFIFFLPHDHTYADTHAESL